MKSKQGLAERVAAQDVVHNSNMVQEDCRQNVKKARKKDQKNAFHTQGSQTRKGTRESALMASLPDDAHKAENIMPVGEEGSSAGTLSQKVSVRNY